jgi:hypothetical protein
VNANLRLWLFLASAVAVGAAAGGTLAIVAARMVSLLWFYKLLTGD